MDSVTINEWTDNLSWYYTGKIVSSTYDIEVLTRKFLSKITFGEDCWEWNKSKDEDGYGYFYDGSLRPSGKPWTKKAHRVSLAIKLGREIHLGLKSCHTCDNPSCVRPSHLYEGTQVQNEQDKVRAGRHANQKKTHCPSGHELTDNNIYRRPNKPLWRDCLKCRTDRDKSRKTS